MSTTHKRGGKRPGAGRPRVYDDHIKVTVSFEGDMLDLLDAECRRLGSTRSRVVQRAVCEFLYEDRMNRENKEA